MAIEQADQVIARLGQIDSERQLKIDTTKWELTMLRNHQKELRLVGRDCDYNCDDRMKKLQLRLDHLLGFHTPPQTTETVGGNDE